MRRTRRDSIEKLSNKRRPIESEAQDKRILLYYFMCILGSADDFVIRRKRRNKLT